MVEEDLPPMMAQILKIDFNGAMNNYEVIGNSWHHEGR